MTKTIILGNEYDGKLKNILVRKLKSLGAKTLSANWGIAGSQELNFLSVEIDGEIINIESETFVGLSISGRDSLVEEIARIVAAESASD